MKKSYQLIFLLIFFLQANNVYSENVKYFSGYEINSVIIVRKNVFDLTDPKEKGLLGSIANKIHFITKESVIKNELLFDIGDEYDPLVILETERNLRNLNYITDIKIETQINHEKRKVTLIVHTKDQWTLVSGAIFRGTHNKLQKGIDIGDTNFLGTGQSIKYGIDFEGSKITHTVGFSDPTIFHTRFLFNIDLKSETTEDSLTFDIIKPFYSLNTKSAYGVSHKTVFHDEQRFNLRTLRSRLFYGKRFKFGDDNILRASSILSIGERKLRRAGEDESTIRDNKLLFSFVFFLDSNDFQTDYYLDKYNKAEDIPLGYRFNLLLGPRTPLLGATSSDLAFEVGSSKACKIRERDYLKYNFSLSLNDDFFNDKFYKSEIRYYFRDIKWQSIVLRLNASYLSSDTNKLGLGGTEGLRGFEKDEFFGSGRFLFNVEERIFTFRPFLYQIFEPALVLFSDFGTVWDLDRKDKAVHGIQGAIGFGVRLAVLKSPGISFFRVDVGFPVTRSSSPVITMGMEGFF